MRYLAIYIFRESLNINRFLKLTLVIGIIFGLFSCSNKNAPNSGKSKLKFAPPGTNHLFEKIFIDETEVTNLSWREYMYWNRRAYGDNSPEFLSTLPDTTVWESCSRDFTIKTKQYWIDIESMVSVYLRHSQFSHFPVVGVSFEQAKQFCAWRTDRLNEVYYTDKHRNVTFPIDSSIVIPKKVEFRIPSEEEWELAARVGFDSSRFINNSDKYYFNTIETASERTVNQYYLRFIPMMDYSLKPDKYNRYHLTGNVAEMVDMKGVAKGGSYIHTISDSYYTKRINYTKPAYWLGFRCVCEIL